MIIFVKFLKTHFCDLVAIYKQTEVKCNLLLIKFLKQGKSYKYSLFTLLDCNSILC